MGKLIKWFDFLPKQIVTNLVLTVLGVIFFYIGTVFFSFIAKIFNIDEVSKATVLQIIQKIMDVNVDIWAVLSLLILGGLNFLTGKALIDYPRFKNVGKKVAETGYSTITGLIYVMTVMVAMLFIVSFYIPIDDYSHLEIFFLFLGYFGFWQIVEWVVEINENKRKPMKS